MQDALGNIKLYIYLNTFGKQSWLWNNLDELREMVRVPLTDPHCKGVDVLVHLVEEGYALDDHVVRLVHVELDLGSAVAVAETELGLVRCN